MVRAGADFSAMRTEMQRAQQNIAQFKNKVNGMIKGIGAMIAAIGIGKAIKDSLDFYDYLSTQENKLAVIMRQRMGATAEATDSIKKFISAQEALGVVGVEVQTAGAQELATYLEMSDSLKTLIPVMNDMVVQQFGFKASGEQAVSIATMMGKVMDGQVGALSRYGYTFDEAQEKILKFGNEQQRAALLAEIVRDSLGNMNEAMANTPQGRAAQLANEFAGLKYEIGVTASIFRDILMPVLSRVISFATAVAVRLQQVGLFFNALFGKSSKSSTVSQAKATNVQTAAVGGLGNAYDKTGKKAKKAGQEAKKAAGSVAGFDQINSLADKSASSGSGSDTGAGGGAGGADGGDFSMPDTGPLESSLPKISEKVQALADKVRGFFGGVKDFFKGVGSFIAEHKDIIISVLAGIGAGLATFAVATYGPTAAFAVLSNTLKVGAAIMNGLKVAMAFLLSPVGLIVVAVAALTAAFVYFYRTNEGFRDFVNNILDKIKDAAVYLWQNVLVPLGEWLGTVFVAAWDAITASATWYWKNVLVPFGAYCVKFYNEALKPLAKILADVLGTAFKTVSELGKSFWKNVMVPLGDFLKSNFKPAVEAISAVLNVLWKYAIQPLAEYIGNAFIIQFKILTAVVENLWKNVFKPLSSFVTGALTSAFQSAGETIGHLKTYFKGLMDFITGVFTGDWSRAWNGVKDTFASAFGALSSIAKTPLNAIIGMINKVIDSLNGLNIKVPDWIPGMGGKSFGFSIPHIPRLARGGIVDGATNMGNYIAGEAGKEMIVPLENTGFVDKLASALGTAVMSAMQFNKSGNQQQGDLVIKIDGSTMARVLNPYLAQEKNRIGNTMIKTI
ncbi:hypothetical protein [Neobacillus sp. NPDC093127]|uniref:phage tail protein n=1 Tax=Neobacillus sp. NPDC093127 TaxID=3364296 RepID=UPI0037FC3380